MLSEVAVKHWHVQIRNERDRTVGALATTWEAAEAEAAIERATAAKRDAVSVECTKDCFGSRKP